MFITPYTMGFPGGSDSKEFACNAGTQVLSLGQEDPLEKEMATHSSIFAWRIPWTEEPGGPKSTGLQRVTQACATTSFFLPLATYTTLNLTPTSERFRLL